ncbi:MAG: OmpA family protein [Alphaproteobacteria bacterium]|nr:OmpA family protein [Alphaproteobacteria bacterium]
MKNKTCSATYFISRALVLVSLVAVAACARDTDDMSYDVSTPTVDYVERLDVYSAPHKDSFLNQLAMNYRSYAIYNARTSGYPDMGELFAQKAVAAFSGELPFPETMENWPVDDEQTAFELYTAYNELMDQLRNDASDLQPELAAEVQAKYDCWLSATASGQDATARQCRDRFQKAMVALRDCRGGKIISKVESQPVKTVTNEFAVQDYRRSSAEYYPETRNMQAMSNSSRSREGVIIVNNVNVPENLIKPEPVQPMVFNQNIYGGDKTVTTNREAKDCQCAYRVCKTKPCPPQPVVQEPCNCPNEDLVTRAEFIDMMMAMREELAAINARLDKLQAAAGEKTMIKVQQIPLEPKQHVMEEVFEVRFDFNKAIIKPEYRDLIEKLASATQANKNIKVSVVGHTDTAGSKSYNYALGGRRAEAVQKMLIQYGIPASQIVAVSSGEEDLAVPTPDNTPNAANRRVRVVKETHYTSEEPGGNPIAVEVGGYASGSCGEYGCDM